MMPAMKWTIAASAALALGLIAAGAGAQDARNWPDRPVHIVVPLTAGSATDVMARMVAKQLSQQLGQQFIVENKPGAGGTIGTGAVARAKAGWLYAAGAVGLLHGDADHLSQHAVRHPARPRGRDAARAAAAGAGRLAGQGHRFGADADRHGEGQARHAELRLGRRRHGEPAQRRSASASAPASMRCTCRSRARPRR
jgi:hypothetical protein